MGGFDGEFKRKLKQGDLSKIGSLGFKCSAFFYPQTAFPQKGKKKKGKVLKEERTVPLSKVTFGGSCVG